MVEVFANSGDPDQMPYSVASDLGLHCLSVTLLGVSRLQWVNSHPSIFYMYWYVMLLLFISSVYLIYFIYCRFELQTR